MGREFLDDALAIDIEREGVRVTGFAGLPTLHRPDPGQQYLFVNGRPVRDRLLIGAVRAAYGDLVPKARYPLLALFVELAPREVDVNVHPTKAEVRFRDAGAVRGLVAGALRAALEAAGHRASVAGGLDALGALARSTASAPSGAAQPGGKRLAGPRPIPSHRGVAPHPSQRPGGRFRRGLAGAARRVWTHPAPSVERPRARGGRAAGPPARRGAGAGARDLHRGADPRLRGHRRPARRPRAPGVRAHQGEPWPTAAWRGRPC